MANPSYRETIVIYATQVKAFLANSVLTDALTEQIVIGAIALGIGWGIGHLVRLRLQRIHKTHTSEAFRAIAKVGTTAICPVFAALTLQIVTHIARTKGLDVLFLEGLKSLCWAFVLVRTVGAIFWAEPWVRQLALVAWFIAALHIGGLLHPMLAVLDSIALPFNNMRISLLEVIKTGLLLVFLIPLSNILSQFFSKKIDRMTEFSPSMRVLFGKLFHVSLYTVSILLALNMVGLNMRLLTMFGGALGLGVGFGLQRVVSNLVSGLILLLDNSIKPGDVIEVEGVYGWIESLNARYASVVTRDGTSYLIPNDELITNKVINWTYSGAGLRIKIPLGVAYEADVPKAMALMEECALKYDRVLKTPRPATRLKAFGTSAVELELRMWIRDPQNGIANIKSTVQLAIWDAFHENNITLPFAQRDVHIKNGSELSVRVVAENAQKGQEKEHPETIQTQSNAIFDTANQT
ncbi:mechanosensitive ion channel family protein [Desulfovibrio inopinatus]|uniref:mechanosensitive ion channel family protein n=1 Tax=Desulfovibrio inopinatus TaxID=102109 RepID=UPI00042383BC|nr:mechanosensitive ion channel domain-containing protein [Desulfovibrio inopinatus]